MKSAAQNLIAAATLSAIALAAALLGLAELGRSTPDQKPLAFQFDVAEDAIAAGLVDAAKTKADFERAAAHAKAAIRQSAYNNNARLRLAFIDARINGRLTKVGEAELARTYDLVPYDPTIAAWRIRFALEHWQDLRPSTRRDVQREALSLGTGTAVSRGIAGELKSVQNPIGQVPARLWLMVLKLRSHPR